MTVGSLISGVWSWVKNTVTLNNNESEEGKKENDSNTSEVSQTIIHKENKHPLEDTPPLPQEGPSIRAEISKESPSKSMSGNEHLSPSETNTSVGNKENTLTNISDIRDTLRKKVEGLTGPYAYAGKWYTENISSESSNKVNDINSSNIIGDSKDQSATVEVERTPVIGNEETKIKQNLYENNKEIATKGNSGRINHNRYFHKHKIANLFTAEMNYALESKNVKNSVLHETAYDLPNKPRERLKKTIYEKYGLTLKDAPDATKTDLNSLSPREAPTFGNSFNDSNSSKSHRRMFRNKFEKYDLHRNDRDIQFPSRNYNPQISQNQSNSLQGTGDEILK